MSEQKEIKHVGYTDTLKNNLSKAADPDLSSEESIELLLCFASTKADIHELSHRLISEFGSFKGVLDAPIDALKKIPGIGENDAVLIKLVPEMLKKCLKEEAADIKYLNSTQDAVKFLKPEFACLNNEAFIIVCLDDSNKILKKQLISTGSINSAEVDIRKILSDVLNFHASRIIFAHNHPGGTCTPSNDDFNTTSVLANSLDKIHVEVTDHLIFSQTDFFSFADNPKFAASLHPADSN